MTFLLNVIVKVTAVNNAVKGNNAVDIESGNIIAISAKGDGIKTSNSNISNKGNQRESLQSLAVTLMYMQPVMV